jgi:hypothetical protein
MAAVNLSGKMLGGYQILEEIGRGGMAVVYRAFQPSLNRHVAVKILPPYLALDAQFIERFVREARAAARLRHPNIVVIHDIAQQDGIHYIAMEYLEGQTLQRVIEQGGALSPVRAARITHQIASALDYAHHHGLVHRDIKPANIFVGADDHVTLTDFGIAKAASETQQLTRTGMLIGTPEYMSPEQATGSAVDGRTDLYALGVVLYQMVTGRVPFSSTTPHAVLHAVIYEPPPPPRQLNPRIPPGVEQVLLRALAKRPEERFQTGQALAQALDQARTGTTARPQPAQASQRRVRPVLPLVLGLAALMVLVLGGWLLISILGPGPQSTPALLNPGGTETALALGYQVSTTAAAAPAGDRAGTETAAAEATATAWALEQAKQLATAEEVQRQASLTAAAVNLEGAAAATQTAAALEGTLEAIASTQTAAAVQGTLEAMAATETAVVRMTAEAMAGTMEAIAATQTAMAAVPTDRPIPTREPTDAEREAALLRRVRWREGNGVPVFAYYAARPPVLDGVLDTAGEWVRDGYRADAVVYQPANWTGPADASGQFYVAWDRDHLYLGVEVWDDVHVQESGGAKLYNGDDVELQIDADLEGDWSRKTLSDDDGQVGFAVVDPATGTVEAQIWRPDALQGPFSPAYGARMTARGYVLEVAIPWWALNLTPRVERPFGFCLSLSDTDTPGKTDQESMVSNCPKRKWGDPTTWGTLILVNW